MQQLLKSTVSKSGVGHQRSASALPSQNKKKLDQQINQQTSTKNDLNKSNEIDCECNKVSQNEDLAAAKRSNEILSEMDR